MIDTKVEAMRFAACLPQLWWEFCVTHAVHLYNCTPVRRLDWKTPYESFHNKRPDISHLRTLGSGAYVYLPLTVRKNKLSPKLEMMIFLSFKESVKNMLFMCTTQNVLFVGTTATFAVLPLAPHITSENPVNDQWTFSGLSVGFQ